MAHKTASLTPQQPGSSPLICPSSSCPSSSKDTSTARAAPSRPWSSSRWISRIGASAARRSPRPAQHVAAHASGPGCPQAPSRPSSRQASRARMVAELHKLYADGKHAEILAQVDTCPKTRLATSSPSKRCLMWCSTSWPSWQKGCWR